MCVCGGGGVGVIKFKYFICSYVHLFYNGQVKSNVLFMIQATQNFVYPQRDCFE